MTRDQRVFYAKPYPGNFRHYVPAQRLNPTPNLILASTEMQRPRSGGNALTYRTVRQGRNSVNQHHDYSYGASKRSLRPVVTDDEEWLMSLDDNYNPYP